MNRNEMIENLETRQTDMTLKIMISLKQYEIQMNERKNIKDMEIYFMCFHTKNKF